MKTAREIRFRIWDTVLKTMMPDFDNWIDFHVMQFTGLTDKNGKEIYEGDIILEGITRKIILWKDGSFHIQVPGWKPNADMPTRPIWMDTLSPEGIQFEVIGNIYENPDLLK